MVLPESVNALLPIASFLVLLAGGILAWREFGLKRKQGLVATVASLLNTVEEYEKGRAEDAKKIRKLEGRVTKLEDQLREAGIEPANGID